MSNELPVFKIGSKTAVELAAHAGHFQDLTFVADTLKMLLDDQGGLSVILQKSLWTAALVAYARCFASGKRLGLSDDIYNGFQGDPKAVHEHMIQMRNKHLSHSVNPFENIEVGAIVENRRVTNVLTVSISHLIPDKNGVENCYRLVCQAREFIRGKCEILHNQCLAEAQATDVDEILKLQVLQYTAPGPEAASTARK